VAAAAGRRAQRPVRQLPEPERFWIRFAPRAWPTAPAAPVRWLDLARGGFGRPGTEPTDQPEPAGNELPPLPDGPFDDVLYVPPVAPGYRAARDRALGPILEAGTPVLVQILAGEEPPPRLEIDERSAPVVVADLLDLFLAEKADEAEEPGEDDRLTRLERVPPGAVVVWPLVAGLTDGEAFREEGLGRLAGAGAAVVQPVVPELSPAERRGLAEGRDDRVFDALFHGRSPDPSELARAVVRHGMAPFLERPLPRPPLGGAPGREIGGLLLLAGDLCQRLGYHGRGQAHFRAARWVDRTRYDMKVLAAEGNLEVIPWLDPASQQIVREWARSGRSETVDTLIEEAVGPVG